MKLVVLYDSEQNLRLCREHVDDLAEIVPVPIGAPPLWFDRDADMMLCADLSNAGLAEALGRELQSDPPRGDRRIFVVRTEDRAETVRATRLGATALVHPASPRLDFVEALFALGTLAPVPRWSAVPPELRRPIENATAMVGHLLDGSRRTPVNIAFVEAVAGTIVEAVTECGPAEWVAAARQHGNPTSRHGLIVPGLAVAWAQKLGFGQADTRMMAVASCLHDLGKARMPADLRNKRTQLTPQEWRDIRRHTLDGAAMLAAAGGADPRIVDMVLHHHERIDGSGYPHRLSGREVSDPVRLLAILDVFSALVGSRAYRRAFRPEEALRIMRGMVPGLDPVLLSAFVPLALECRKALGAEDAPPPPAATGRISRPAA